MEPVRVGVIGCGVIANGAHFPALAETPNLELVAVCDIIEEKAKAAADKYSVPDCYTNAVELIQNNDVEAVIYAFPTGARTPFVYRGLEAGKHALVEKPSTSTLAEIDQFAARAGSSVLAFCSSRFTFTESAKKAAELVKSGALGPLREVRVFVSIAAGAPPAQAPPNWRESFSLNGGGILLNWGCYDLDYMLYVAGDTLQPREIFAHWWPVANMVADRVGPEGDADAHYSAAIRCDANVLLSIERAEFSSLESQSAWQIIGENGSLTLDLMLEQEKRFVFSHLEPDVGLVSETIFEGSETNKTSVKLLEDFAFAIRTGTPPRTGFTKARIIQSIYDGIYRSAACGTSVSVR